VDLRLRAGTGQPDGHRHPGDDALALQSCLSGSEITARDQAISQAVQTIKAANTNVKVYLDGGHSAWNSRPTRAAGSRRPACSTPTLLHQRVELPALSNEAAYGRSIISYLESQGISGKHQVIDTSRNGGRPVTGAPTTTPIA